MLEAIAMGRPIVTTDVPGCRNVVEHGVNGLMVPAQSVSALKIALQELLADPAKRKQMGLAARAKAEREFDEEVVIRQTLGVYQELVGEKMPALAASAAARPDSLARYLAMAPSVLRVPSPASIRSAVSSMKARAASRRTTCGTMSLWV